MPVNAILFLSFRQFKHFILDYFVQIVCVFCVRACARHFFLYVYAIFWFLMLRTHLLLSYIFCFRFCSSCWICLF